MHGEDDRPSQFSSSVDLGGKRSASVQASGSATNLQRLREPTFVYLRELMIRSRVPFKVTPTR